MSEMSKWFDIHFAISKINKGEILKLSLVLKSDVFNAWTKQVIDIAIRRQAWHGFILFLNFAFWHKIFMFASSTNWYGTS